VKRAVALAILLAATSARADGPVVDPADLPPLPAAEEEPSSSATVLAAANASEDVVSGAAKREQSLGNVASAVTVISGDRIRRFGYRTIGEAVSAVAGAYLENNRLVDSLGIRGLNIQGDFNTRILVLVDGATVNESWGSFAGVGWDTFVTIDDVARIEVIRGPVSSLYGANAFFGILNIVTRGASETPRAWGRAGINSINGVVSSAGFAVGGLHKQVRGTVQVMDRIGEDVTVAALEPLGGGSSRKPDGGHAFAASVVGSYEGAFGQIRAYQNKRGSPFAPYNGDPSVDTPYAIYNTQLLVEGGYTREVSKRFTAAVRAYGNLYRYSDTIAQYMDIPFRDYGDGQTVGAEVRGRYEIVPNKLGVTAGTEASYNHTRSQAYGVAADGSKDAPADIPKNFDIEGVYAEFDGQPTKWLGFTGGARYDRNSAIDQNLSPRGALFFSKPEQYGLKLLYAQGFRNPSAFEAFFYDGVSFAPPDHLGAERITSYEAVAWAKPFPGLSTRLSGFYWDARKVVEQLPDTRPMYMDQLVFTNTGRFVTAGVEAEASYRDSRGWYGFAGATYSHVGEAEEGGSLSYGHVVDAPALVAAGGISTPKLFGTLHVSTELTYVGKRETRLDADGNESPSPAWFGWNAAVYVPNVSGFDITAGVRNILGKRNMVPAPGDYDRTNPDPVAVTQVPGEGRELYVKVGYSY